MHKNKLWQSFKHVYESKSFPVTNVHQVKHDSLLKLCFFVMWVILHMCISKDGAQRTENCTVKEQEEVLLWLEKNVGYVVWIVLKATPTNIHAVFNRLSSCSNQIWWWLVVPSCHAKLMVCLQNTAGHLTFAKWHWKVKSVCSFSKKGSDLRMVVSRFPSGMVF